MKKFAKKMNQGAGIHTKEGSLLNLEKKREIEEAIAIVMIDIEEIDHKSIKRMKREIGIIIAAMIEMTSVIEKRKEPPKVEAEATKEERKESIRRTEDELAVSEFFKVFLNIFFE